MKKRLFFVASLIGLASMTTFMIMTGSKADNYRKFSGSILAAIGLQNATSSQNTASLLSNSTSTATPTPTLTDVLQQLQDQVQLLRDRTADLHSEVEITNLKGIFIRTMKRGDIGDDVSKLQELLTGFPEFYSSDSDADPSSTVTGFYGSLTKAAVARFQAQVGLKETGVFDARTREKLYELISALAARENATEFTPIDISPVVSSKNSGGSQNKISAGIEESVANLQNQVSQLISDSTSTQANVADLQWQISQLTSDLATAKTSITDLESRLAAIPTPPEPPPVPSPSPIPPPTKLAISNVQVVNITKTSSTITWTTNLPSTSEVDYSTNSNLPTDQTRIINNTALVTNHTVGLQNLNAGTKYYYRVISKDNTSATASSTIQPFTTGGG